VPPLNLNSRTVTFTMWIYPGADGIGASTGLLMNRNGSDAAGLGFGSNLRTNGQGTVMAELGYAWSTNSAAASGWHSGLYPVAGVWNFVALVITNNSTTMYLYYCSSDENGATTNLLKAVLNNVTNTSEAFGGGTTWIGSDNWSNGPQLQRFHDEVAGVYQLHD